MQLLSILLLLPCLSTALPAPMPTTSEQSLAQRDTNTAWSWSAGAVSEYTIHPSCNATERSQLLRALNESTTLARHAKEHILRFGNASETYVKYFGNSSTTAEPIGWFEKLTSGDKDGVLFRCDDVDNKCWQAGWAGHWRGEIAPDQTVICPLSFESRWPLDAMCGHGYTIATGKDAQWFGADLLHRLYHTKKMSEGVVDHYADTQAEIIALAKEHPEQAVRNSATLRHFAVEVYAYDIAVPGVGCAGSVPVASSSTSGVAASTSAVASASATIMSTSSSVGAGAASTTAAAPASTVQSAATECHTHADGVVHCA